ncbi:protein of unknown function [Clostridium beijerinckii]|nr:protein of unknown function [Clostridium beijerinckii]
MRPNVETNLQHIYIKKYLLIYSKTFIGDQIVRILTIFDKNNKY